MFCRDHPPSSKQSAGKGHLSSSPFKGFILALNCWAGLQTTSSSRAVSATFFFFTHLSLPRTSASPIVPFLANQWYHINNWAVTFLLVTSTHCQLILGQDNCCTHCGRWTVSFRQGEHSFLSLYNYDLALKGDATFQSLVSEALGLSHSHHRSRMTGVLAEGSRGALEKTDSKDIKTFTLERRKLEKSGLYSHLPRCGEYDFVTVDEDGRLLIELSICFGKCVADAADKLSRAAAEKHIEDIGTHTPVDCETHTPVFFLSSSTCLLSHCDAAHCFQHPPSYLAYLAVSRPQQPLVWSTMFSSASKLLLFNFIQPHSTVQLKPR